MRIIYKAIELCQNTFKIVNNVLDDILFNQ